LLCGLGALVPPGAGEGEDTPAPGPITGS